MRNRDPKYKQGEGFDEIDDLVKSNKGVRNSLKDGQMKERQGEAFEDFNELLKTKKGEQEVP